MTPSRARARAWAELLRISALFTVPGDALAGAAATRTAPNRGTALAMGASLCLYEAGMALNDWADRDIDAVERPRRPLPSGRITPAVALTAATGLTAAGLLCAAPAGRRALATATALAGTVWAYDLGLKNTPAGPYAMAAARSLDLLLGATATAPTPARHALPPAALLGAHTLAVTAVSRHEATGGTSKTPLAALATATTVAWAATRPPTRTRSRTRPLASAALAAAYLATAARPFAHAALNPSPHLLQRAVGGGIRAMIPLQAALAQRAGAGGAGAGLLLLVPVARRLSRKVSPT
ncbi:SCO3242 family prenyltransferase [Streptomyces sp. NBRC 110028]|uniref:SCO3242 family prenyltransferase n=1 Tax=Streptomyces sp. NBRC 110028 TaxID=1621260 RepID=UPI0006E282CF|nr:UbiA family prenyltransferase [Streptomyces sp. NBRC 110028]